MRVRFSKIKFCFANAFVNQKVYLLRIGNFYAQIILLLFSGIIFCLFAQESRRISSPLTQYIHNVYSTEEGLPQNRIRAIVQTKDGFLWIGTQDGLARFNGAVFNVFNKENTSQLKHNDITSLFESVDGSLWIGTFNGITHLKNGKFIQYDYKTGQVRGLAQDKDGNLIIGTMNEGIIIHKNGKYESITTERGLLSNSLNTIAVDKQGNIWAALSGRGLAVFRNGKLYHYNKENGFPSNSVRSFFVSSDSAVWIGTENGLVKWKNSFWHVYEKKNGLPDNIVTALYEDRTGTLWIGTERAGICRMENNSFTSFNSIDGLSADYVTSIFEDREGCLWVGTFNAGLNQFWRGKFSNITYREGAPKQIIRSLISSDDGKVYAGSEGGGVIYFDDKFKKGSFSVKLPSDYIRSLFEDSNNGFWIGLREGLAHYQKGKLKIYTTKDGLKQNFIRVIAEDKDKNIWLGTYNNGVQRFEKGRFVSNTDNELPVKAVRSILAAKNGNVWIGSDEGLYCWNNGNINAYHNTPGIPAEPIFCMMEDNESVLWLGTYGGGLIRYKENKFTRFTVEDGLYNNVVFKILEDDAGNLWMSSMQGLSSVSKSMLDQFANGNINKIQCNVYTSADGMVSSECVAYAGCKTSDGQLWFPTSKGIVIVDIKKASKNTLPPLVAIEKVVINNNEYSPYEITQVEPSSGRVEISYGGMSFIAPNKVVFKFILEGFDSEWRFVGVRRTAFYTNLSPGKYNFRVTACNSEGIWSETGASYSFELKPHYYQTRWFYFLLILILGAFIFSAHRIHIWKLLKREKQLELHVQERTKQLEQANKELEAFSYSVSHDLRAPLRSINGFSNALLEDYQEKLDEQGKDFLTRMRTASRHMEQLIDDILNLSKVMRSDLNRTSVNLSNIVQRIANELTKSQPERAVTFIIMPGITAQADDNLMEIVLENLLDNAWKFTSKHQTAKIEFGKTYKDGKEIFFVRDDGDGFDMAFAHNLFGAFQRMHTASEFPGTGVGLATVRRIINRHGGEIWAQSEKNKGAVFYFTLQ